MSITATQFKAFFDRGQFTYGTAIPNVRDTDIDNAIAEAGMVYNEDLYDEETIKNKALMYLTAHFLTFIIEDDDGQSNFNQVSRSADGISESLHIPEWMKEGDFALYATTKYGQRFLMISKPYLDGAIYTSEGETRY